MGLYSLIQIEKGEVICDFIGEFISFEETQRRVDLGRGGYQLQGPANKVLDCYNFRDVCKASMANSPFKYLNIQTGNPAIVNSKLVYDRNRYKFKLLCTKTIYPNDEIMYDIYIILS